jgi:hypothetical protein
MRRAPSIPAWIKRFKHPGYTNAFEFLPDNCPRFFATETLFGDWDAPVLLLAKDTAPTQVMCDRVKVEGTDGWRHSQRARGDRGGYQTNERLLTMARQVPCAKLYGSATANMLYDDPGWSRSLPDFHSGPLHEYLVDVLRWVVGNMPELRVVACLGREAWYLTAVVLGRSDIACEAGCRDKERMIDGVVNDRTIMASAHYHPARASLEQRRLGWSQVVSTAGE